MRRGQHYRGGYQVAGLTKRARELRESQTAAEELLWGLLRDKQLLGFKFRRQHQFGDYIADFYCRDAQLVIECDGPVHHDKNQWHHDLNRDEYMLSMGLRVLRFSNEEVITDTDRVLKVLRQYLLGVSLKPSP